MKAVILGRLVVKKSKLLGDGYLLGELWYGISKDTRKKLANAGFDTLESLQDALTSNRRT